MTWIHLVDTPPAWDNGVVDILWSLVIPTIVVSAMERGITIGNALKIVRKQRVTTKVQAVGEAVLLMVVVVGEAVILMVVRRTYEVKSQRVDLVGVALVTPHRQVRVHLHFVP
jgi:hypothetical protein